MRRLSIVIATGGIVMALVGCAKQQPIVWRPAGTEQEYKRDNYQCAQESRTSWSGGGSGVVGPLMIMSAKQNAEAESRRLYIMCMEARGYSQVKSGEPYLGFFLEQDAAGLRVKRLNTAGPAENAGLRIGDVISEVDERRMVAVTDLRAVLDTKAPGDRLSLLVLRAGAAQWITVTVGRRP